MKELHDMYKEVDYENLFNNRIDYLEAMSQVFGKDDMRMEIHTDERAWQIFGLPRISTEKETIEKMLKAVDKPYNGLTLCTGSLGSNQNNDICGIIEAAKGRIPFAHVRNLNYNNPSDFEEAANLSADGSVAM